jgi:DNA processing protein
MYDNFNGGHTMHTDHNMSLNSAASSKTFSLSKSKIELLTQAILPRYFPETMHAQGNETLLQAPRVAIIGSRKPTLYGRQLVVKFASELAKAGICVVSGGALGIDFLATKSALEFGHSIVVVGGGLACTHPSSHRAFLKEIVRSGKALVMSQFPNHEQAAPWHFPKRNVTLALLSDFILVIEAGEKSGSLITARAALDHGVDLGAIPGDIHSPLSKGTNGLISEGAFCITRHEEIIERVSHLRWLRRVRA